MEFEFEQIRYFTQERMTDIHNTGSYIKLPDGRYLELIYPRKKMRHWTRRFNVVTPDNIQRATNIVIAEKV